MLLGFFMSPCKYQEECFKSLQSTENADYAKDNSVDHPGGRSVPY